MYQLKTAHVFYGLHPYEMHVTGLDTIEGVPSRDSVVDMLVPHMMGIGRDEINRRLRIERVPGSPERIVAHGSGFNVTWVKVAA